MLFQSLIIRANMCVLLRVFAFLVVLFPRALLANTMKEIPKAELHLHLGGSYPLEYVLSIASEDQREKLNSGLEKISQGVDYSSVFGIFPLVSQIVNTEEKIEKGTEALCKWLAADGVTYVEIRTGLKNLGKGYEEYLLSVLRGMSTCSSQGVTAKLLLSLQRASTPDIAKVTVDLAIKYKKEGIVGLDLSGDSTLGNLKQIISQFKRAKNNGLHLSLHLGESPKETKQEKLLKLLKPERVGHGVHLSKNAKKWIIKKRIPLEVCLSSSQQVNMVQNYTEHPGFEFYKMGHPITLCTDDPLIFGSSLSNEYELFQKGSGLSDNEMAELARESFRYSF